MKKLLSHFLAAAAALTMGSTAMAEDTPVTTAAQKSQAATFAFDTDAGLVYLHPFGNAQDTKLSLKLSDTGAKEGRCLAMGESFSTPVSNQYGGFYIDSADLGLETFAGYTITVNVSVNKKVNKLTDNLVLFTDGEQWVTSNITTSNPENYVKASLTVPAGVANSKVGISLPITTAYDGDVCYVDDIVIIDNYGKQIPNIGDLDTSLAEKPNTALTVLSTILFIILALGIIGVIGFLVYKKLFRFR